MSTAEWPLIIEMESDWHVGTGQGEAGGVDRSVARDADGLPCLPAKELKGLWRDACERVAWGFDDGATGQWSLLVERLFGARAGSGGRPQQAAALVWVSDARLPQAWRTVLSPGSNDAEMPLIRDGLTRTRFGVAINGSSGTARDDTLREIEVSRAGLRLKATCEVPANLPWQAELLLKSGLKCLDHVGSKRRRGLGRCVVTMKDDNVTALVKAHAKDLAALQADTVMPALGAPVVAQNQGSSSPPSAPHWRRRARVQLVTRQPVLAARTVLGNTVIGHEFVPGATLLPLALRACDGGAALVRDGRIVVTDATVTIGQRRTSPTPLGLVSDEKGTKWLSTGKVMDVFAPGDLATGAGFKSVGGWTAPLRTTLGRTTIPMLTRAHAVINDEKQCTADNGVFLYEAIAPGTLLQFEIWDDGSLDNVGVWHPERLGRTCRIGRSRSSGYGQVEVSLLDEQAPGAQHPPGQLWGFVLTLQSDTCVIDKHGIPTPTAQGLAEWLGSELGVSLSVERSRVAVRRRDAWFGELAAPKASVMTLAAGSQIQFSVLAEDGLDSGRLQQLVDAGLGIKCAEGFGRAAFAVGHRTSEVELKSHQAARPKTEDPDEAAAALKDDEVWEQTRREAWRDEIHRRVVDLPSAARHDLVAPGVSKSQLGSLREAANQGRPAVQRWVASTKGREGYLKAWGQERIELLEKLAGDSTKLATWLKKKTPYYSAQIPDDLGGNDHDAILALVLGELIRRESLAGSAAKLTPGEG